MPWRFLVDEDTDTDTANELAARGFEAETVASALGKGVPDSSVVAFARRENRIRITTDRDFLVPSRRRGIRVLMVADDRASGSELAERAAELATRAEDPSDLQPVTWI